MLSYETSTALQAAAAATGNGTAMAVAGIHTVTVQVSGTFAGTITFEGTQDNTNWVALRAYNLTTGVVATTTTGAGIFAICVVGLQHFRARVSAYTSGAITATGRALSPSIPLPWTDLATFAGTAPQLDDTDKLAVSLYGKGSAAGDQALLVESASNPNLRVSLYEGGSQVEMVASNADDDSIKVFHVCGCDMMA